MMTKALYTARAYVDGGRNGRGRTSDGQLDLALRQPKELGGDGAGVNPEQLFAIGYAACFGTTLALVGGRDNLKADDAEIDASVSLVPADGRFVLGVRLEVTLPSVTHDQATALVQATHGICPYSTAINGNVDVALVVNGKEL